METEDQFKFTVMDSKPNELHDLIFHITWSSVEFGVSNVSAEEKQKVIEIPVIRTGSLNTVSIAEFISL